MSNHQLNQLDAGALQIVTNETTSEEFYLVEGAEISWVEVQPKTGVTFNTDINTHRWTDLNIYSESNAIKYGLNESDGGLADVLGFSDVYTAYNSGGMICGSIASSAYRTSIHPNAKITIPITGGTGTLSGLTSLDLYTAFVYQNNSTTSDGSGPCATWLVDSLYSESKPEVTFDAGLGYAYDIQNNPSSYTNGQYRSGIMHLFANQIYFSGNTGTTWDTGWSGSSRYTFSNSPLAISEGTTRNKSVGVLHVDSGLITLFNQEIVSLFNTSVATGGTITSGLTFPTSECSAIIRDKDFSTELQINTTLYPQDFVQSNNLSVLDAKKANIDCNGQVGITSICYYDKDGKMTAKASLSEPVYKSSEDFTLIKSAISLDGGLKDILAGRTTFGPPL